MKNQVEENYDLSIPMLVSGIVLSLLLIIYVGFNSIGAGDTWWYVSCGRYIVQNMKVPLTDVFSFTFQGKTWINSEWLTNVVFYLIFSNFGKNPLAMFKIIMVIIILSIVCYRVYLKTGDYYLVLMCLTISCFVGRVFLDIRAQLFTFFFINVCLLLLDFYRNGKKWILYVFPLFVVPWVNFHGGFMYLFFILGSLWLAELIGLFLNIRSEDDKKIKKALKANDKKTRRIGDKKEDSIDEKPDGRKKLWLLTVIIFITLFLGLINPYGIMVYEWPFRILYQPSFKETLEWIPPWRIEVQGFTTPLYWPYILFFVTFSFLNYKRLAREELIVSWLTMFMSISSRRFIPLFILVSLPMFMEAIHNSLGYILHTRKLSRVLSQVVVIIIISGLFMFIIGSHVFQDINKIGLFNYMTTNYTFPESACDFMKQNQIRGRLFNYYNWGGYIMWHLYPDMLIFIDGRAHGVYDEEIYDEYKSIDYFATVNSIRPDPKCWEAIMNIMNKYNIEMILLSKFTQMNFATILDQHSSEWYLLYQDHNSALFLRNIKKNDVYIKKREEGKLYIPPAAKEYMFAQ